MSEFATDDTAPQIPQGGAAERNLSRRNILLGGTTLAAASSTAPIGTAQAQQRPAPTVSMPPNTLLGRTRHHSRTKPSYSICNHPRSSYRSNSCHKSGRI